ncbi:MAG: HlyD family efflux transporter periplasmic adaptor subunit [Chloroflexi bacterium]|nr:HlyD family efflux transporter periplasmic adaptor subunit [Chloroflexota bacterium]
MKSSLVVRYLLILFALGGLLTGCQGPSATAAAPSPTDNPENVLKPVQADESIVAEGVLIPAQHASLSFPTTGTIAEILVSEGDYVEKGRELIRIEATSQKAMVAQAEARLARAQARLASLKAGARAQEIAIAQAALDRANAQKTLAIQGPLEEEIAAAQAAVALAKAALQKTMEGADKEQIVAARAELANARARLEQAQAAYDRVKDAPDIGARPESLQLQLATNQYDAAKARLDALLEGASPADIEIARAKILQAQSQLDALTAPPRPAQLAILEANVQESQAQLDLLKAGARPEDIAVAETEVAEAQYALELALAALADTVIRAPFAGTVVSSSAQLGEYVTPGEALLTLADFSDWRIETKDLTELEIGRVTIGDAASLTFDAIPDLTMNGVVQRIEPRGEAKHGDVIFTVIIKPERVDERFLWNMSVNVILDSQETDN